MEIILFILVVAFLYFVMYRWDNINQMIEARKPNYKYITWLECKADLSLEQFVQENIAGSRHFHGLHGQGLYGTLKVLGCDQCQMIYDEKGEIADEMIPCYTHVKWFDN